MSAAVIAENLAEPPPRRRDSERWKQRSLVMRRLRVLLPATIGLIFLALLGTVIYHAIAGRPAQPVASNAPIRLVNPRFVGRDDKGRAFVLTARAAIRDQRDYQRVVLDRPSLSLDDGGKQPLRVTAKSGVYHEGARKLELEGGVRLSSDKGNFDTAASLYDTKTGVLAGSGPIHGTGSLGEINAKSYGVFDKGDRMVFKGGVRARINAD
jgi:lipopolysaccharide export system protein LptC